MVIFLAVEAPIASMWPLSALIEWYDTSMMF